MCSALRREVSARRESAYVPFAQRVRFAANGYMVIGGYSFDYADSHVQRDLLQGGDGDG